MGFYTFAVGENFTATKVNTYLSQQRIAIKSATESVTSSTSLQNDDHLSFTVNANTNYWVEGILFMDGATGGDIKIAIVIPSGTLRWCADGLSAGAAASQDIVDRRSKNGGGSGTAHGTLGAGTTNTFLFRGIARIGSTGGTLQLQWAQNTSSGTSTRLFANSLLRAQRVLT